MGVLTNWKDMYGPPPCPSEGGSARVGSMKVTDTGKAPECGTGGKWRRGRKMPQMSYTDYRPVTCKYKLLDSSSMSYTFKNYRAYIHLEFINLGIKIENLVIAFLVMKLCLLASQDH